MGFWSSVGSFMTGDRVDAPRGRGWTHPDDEARSYSLGQLGLHLLHDYPGALGVSSIDEALRDAATWQCVKVKASGLASLPVDVVRYEDKRRITVSPAPKVIEEPSDMTFRQVWMFQAGASMFTDGNVFGRVTAVDRRQYPTSIELLDPTKITRRSVEGGVIVVFHEGEEMRRFPHGDLWHLPGEMTEPGSPFGLSPVWYGSKDVATSLAAGAFGGQFFTDGGHPSALLKPKTDPGQDGAKQIKEAFLGATQGKREPAVLPQSVEYQQLQIDPKDSQFIDLMMFQVLQACRRHGVPPSMVFASVYGQNLTYANVTQADLHFLKHSLSWPIDLFEAGLGKLIPRPQAVKFNRDAILRADAKGRWEIHDLRLKNRTTSVDEVRALEDEEPFGDEFAEPGIPGWLDGAPDSTTGLPAEGDNDDDA